MSTHPTEKFDPAAAPAVHTLGNATTSVGAWHIGHTPVGYNGKGDVVHEMKASDLAQAVHRLTNGAGLAYNTKTNKASPVSEEPIRSRAGLKTASAKNSDIIVIGRRAPGEKYQGLKIEDSQKAAALATAIKLVEETPRSLVVAASKAPNMNTEHTQTQNMQKQQQKLWAGISEPSPFV